MAPRVRGGKSRGRGQGKGPKSPAKRPIVPTRPTSSDYPPPLQLFQSGEGSLHASGGSPRGSGSNPFRASGSTQVRGSVSSVHRLAARSPRAAQSPTPVHSLAPVQSPPLNQPRARASVSGHSSQAQNVEDKEDEEGDAEGESEEEGLRDSTLPEDVLATLNDLLSVYGRELYTTVISPTLEPGTTW
ncbi:unnamed protein product [Arabidopsis lyrata]|nr:unnamed protein product [Arabidopsis lyrata]